MLKLKLQYLGHLMGKKVKVKVAQSLQPHGPHSPWNSPGQNTGMCSLSLLQEILPTQGSNPGLPHCRWILYQLSHKRSLALLQGIFLTQESNRVSCTAGGFFTNWVIRGRLIGKDWFGEILRTRGEGVDRGWDDWMASLTQWTWVWMNSRRWWTGMPGVLQSMGSQRVGYDWAKSLIEQLLSTGFWAVSVHCFL